MTQNTMGKMKSRILIPNVEHAIESAHLLFLYIVQMSALAAITFSDNIAIFGLLHMDASPIV